MEEGYDEDWQQDWQHCSSESDWQHCSSESDWQLGSSDPPLYSPNWKPTIPSVHDNSQVTSSTTFKIFYLFTITLAKAPLSYKGSVFEGIGKDRIIA